MRAPPGRKDRLVAKAITLFVLLVALTAPVSAEAQTADPALVAQVAANQQAAMNRLLQYCFRQNVLFEKLTDDGKVARRDRREEYVCFLDGVPLVRQLAMNGQPTGQAIDDAWPEIRPGENWQKQVRRAAERRQRDRDIIAEVPKAFDFTVAGEDLVDGRPATIYRLTPRPGYRAKSRAGEMLRHVTGRAWVDRETATMVRLQALVENDFVMWGGLLLKVRQGATFEMRQKLVSGNWLPDFADERWSARIGIFSNRAQHQQVERADFRPASLRVAQKK